MSRAFLQSIEMTLADIRSAGLWKDEQIIASPQGNSIATSGNRPMLNFCANDYLGLANDPRLIAAAHAALDERGFGMASVRFICGTQDLHRRLEERLAKFFGMEDCILFSSCFDANGGVFEVLLGEEDAVLSDSLNHASIIDGIRLSKAKRFRYAHGNMENLERQLEEARDARHRLIVTDGVFSMDGEIARLPEICALAEAHDALVMVDDCHAAGFMGVRGAGTPEHFGVEGRVHILTGTLGKALGGASGGYVAGPRPVVDLLRQRARPYLFSNALAPAICRASLAALDIVEGAVEERARLFMHARRFRAGLQEAGFTLIPGEHPIVPVMTGDASRAGAMARELRRQGILVVAFSYPVVPEGEARIRVQLSARHREEDVERAIEAFIDAGHACGVLAAELPAGGN